LKIFIHPLRTKRLGIGSVECVGLYSTMRYENVNVRLKIEVLAYLVHRIIRTCM